jgi:hypothetical protein
MEEENRRPELAPFVIPPSFSSLFGMRIVEAPEWLVPVLKLRADAPVTDAFREEFDAYLLDLFGARDDSLVPRGMAFAFSDRIVMRRSDAVALLNTAA